MTAPQVLLTGATGFVGRHVRAALEQRGIEPVLWSRAAPDSAGRWHAFDLAAADADATVALYRRCGAPPLAIHCAWGGLPNYRSLHHFEQERLHQYRFVKALVQAGLQQLLVTGTCYEYGLRCGALHEGLDPQPATAYGYAKDALRRELQLLAAQQPFALTWARLFYLWGEHQAPQALWPQLQAAAARGDAEFPMSGGEQLRDYLPAAEVARLVVALALGAPDAGIVNVCAGAPTSVRRLVEGWIAERGWAIRPALGRMPYPAHEPFAFWGDRAKLDRCLPTPATES